MSKESFHFECLIIVFHTLDHHIHVRYTAYCSEEANEGGTVEVLDRRFLNLSRPRRMFRVAETRVVV